MRREDLQIAKFIFSRVTFGLAEGSCWSWELGQSNEHRLGMRLQEDLWDQEDVAPKDQEKLTQVLSC